MFFSFFRVSEVLRVRERPLGIERAICPGLFKEWFISRIILKKISLTYQQWSKLDKKMSVHQIYETFFKREV